MPYIENQSNDPVTYTDSGPGGGSGCDTSNIRPKDPITGAYKPLKKGDPPHKDSTIPYGYYVCFYDKNGAGKIAVTDRPVYSKYETAVLKEDGSATVNSLDKLVESLLEALGFKDAEEFSKSRQRK